MQWYKHSTDSHDDPDISDAMDEFGPSGYSAFFILLEIYGREFNSLDADGWLSLSKRFLARKLRLSATKVQSILSFYSERGRVALRNDSKRISFKIPQFIEIASNWTKRKGTVPTEGLQRDSKAPTAKEEDVEEDVEEDNTINPPGGNSVPYSKILGAYHKTLPTLHPCEMSADLQKTLKARWNSKKKMQNIEWWEWYFEGVSGCDFLLGKKTDFAATFPWLIGPRNMTKVLGGQYTNRDRTESAIEDWINE